MTDPQSDLQDRPTYSPWRWQLRVTDPRLPDDPNPITLGAYFTKRGAQRQADHLNTMATLAGHHHKFDVQRRMAPW